MHYLKNIEEETLANEYFRKVLYTDPRFQLVLMSIPPGVDIGLEIHDLDQFIRIESGEGKALIDGEEYALSDGSALVIPKGVAHNVVNTSSDQALKLYSIYAPAQHPAGTIHATKEDALAAEAHEHTQGV